MIMQWGGTHGPEQQDCSEIDDTLEQVILILHKKDLVNKWEILNFCRSHTQM